MYFLKADLFIYAIVTILFQTKLESSSLATAYPHYPYKQWRKSEVDTPGQIYMLKLPKPINFDL